MENREGGEKLTAAALTFAGHRYRLRGRGGRRSQQGIVFPVTERATRRGVDRRSRLAADPLLYCCCFPEKERDEGDSWFSNLVRSKGRNKKKEKIMVLNLVVRREEAVTRRLRRTQALLR
ncbi:hypothetical protein MRB53_028330 [Persea americana]|uniref:Uncharacterized protein n=1 Tax=Persea americana TaxID=3435 RepID=A0ACC2KFE5_PERAE|nr:hypothetical protein MRB53_028330 [Persea americana]